MAFFDEFPRFLTTSQTGATAARLNARHRAIIEANLEIIKGRRILDIASHDGRWSFAALQAGATHVTGIEIRERLLSAAAENFRSYNVAPEHFEFAGGDVFEVLRRRQFAAETVLLLGFFYHTERHGEIASLLARTGASHIILDGNIIPSKDNAAARSLVQLYAEPTASEANAVGEDKTAIVGYPSREAIKLVFGQHGFKVTEFDWSKLRGHPDLKDYNEDRRSTFVLSR